MRATAGEDPFDRIDHAFVSVWSMIMVCGQRRCLFDEVQASEYDRSYPTFTRKLRERQLRPHCEACAGVKGRATVIIDHPSCEEIQWDWNRLGECPWDPTVDVSMLVGSLSHSSKTRACGSPIPRIRRT